MTAHFKPTRASGKSDADILAELVRNGSPGDIFTFDELIARLEENTDRTITKQNVSSIVSATKKRVLSSCDRLLVSVRNVGYRIAAASEHVAVSRGHSLKAKRQFSRAWSTLEHVRRNELSRDELAKHSQQMVKTGELLVVLEQHESRIANIERVLIKARQEGKI